MLVLFIATQAACGAARHGHVLSTTSVDWSGTSPHVRYADIPGVTTRCYVPLDGFMRRTACNFGVKCDAARFFISISCHEDISTFVATEAARLPIPHWQPAAASPHWSEPVDAWVLPASISRHTSYNPSARLR